MPSNLDWGKYRSAAAVPVCPQNRMMQGAAASLTEDDCQDYYHMGEHPDIDAFRNGEQFVKSNREGGKTFKRGDLQQP